MILRKKHIALHFNMYGCDAMAGQAFQGDGREHVSKLFGTVSVGIITYLPEALTAGFISTKHVNEFFVNSII